MISASFSEATVQNSEDVQEFVISTNKAKVTFTNRGGDITSYKLLEHKDKETGSGVEMVNNVTSSNRAFSLSFGGTENPALNDIFNVTKKTIIRFFSTGTTKLKILKEIQRNSHLEKDILSVLTIMLLNLMFL